MDRINKKSAFLLATLLVATIASPAIAYAYSQETQQKTVKTITFEENPSVKKRTQPTPSPDFSYTTRQMTWEEVQELKSNIGVYEEGKKYNEIVNGHGTGLAPPTKAEYEAMVGTKVVDGIKEKKTASLSLPSSYDLSDDQYFPPIGDQASEGSCASWAAAYYANTYLQAKAYGWDASNGNDDYLMSPDWVYHKVNGGSDQGSNLADPMKVVKQIGNADLQTMPYSDTDHTSWGDETAWRDAPQHRATDYTYTSVTNTDTIKSWVYDETPITFAIDANEYNFDGDAVLSSQEYNAGNPNHAQTIIGYDDSISDDGENGAFLVANSWGDTWGPNNNGMYWITYDCVSTLAYDQVYHYTGSSYGSSSSPSLLGVWGFSDTGARDAPVEMGIGSTSSPAESKSPILNGGSSYNFPSFMCLDVTEFKDNWSGGSGSESQFWLNIGSGSSSSTISSFKIENYDSGYTPGSPSDTSSESPDVPATTPTTVTVDYSGSSGNTAPTADFSYSPTSPTVGESVQFTDASSDSDGSISSWDWAFGDGATSTQANPTHTYDSSGTYTVELTVTDDDGATDTASTDITVESGSTDSFSDDFEDGSLGSDWTVSGDGVGTVNDWTANSGSYSLCTGEGSVTVESKTIDLSGASSGTVSVWIRRGDDSFSEYPESGDDLVVEYYTSGGTWSSLETYAGGGTGGATYTPSFDLPSDALHGGFMLRFRQTGGSGSGYDYWHMDDVSVSASDGGGTTKTFTGSVSEGSDSTQHAFDVPSDASKVNVSLEMPSGADFDLSLWDDQGRRTGGWTATSSGTSSDIPNSDYSGYSTDPETITVDPPDTSGTWETGCYAYSGSGDYTITVTIVSGSTSTQSSTVELPSFYQIGEWVSKFMSTLFKQILYL